MNLHGDIVIQPYTHQDLARLYDVSWKTFQKWVKVHEHIIGKKIGHFYSAIQVALIFKLLGYPKLLASLSHKY